MTKHQDLLDREIGTPPPSTIDVDGIVRRQRRWVRLQRAGAVTSAGVLAAALVVGVGILQQTGGTRSPDQPTASAPVDPRADEAARLTRELQTLAGVPLNGSTLLRFVGDPSEPAGDPLVFVDRGTYFFAAAQAQDASGIGTLLVRTGRLGSVYGEDFACPTDPAPLDVTIQCAPQPGPDGSTVIVLTTTRGTYVRHFVLVRRTDGNDVAVEATNGTTGMVAQRPAPVLTREQAVDLATRPGLVSTVE